MRFVLQCISGVAIVPVAREKHAAMGLPLGPKLKIGVQTIRRRTEPATSAWLASIDAMRRLVEFTFGYVQSHPEFIALLLGENLHRARYLRRSGKVRDMHTSLLDVIADLLRRGHRVVEHLLRRGVGGVHRILLVHHFHRLIGRIRSAIRRRRRIV